MPFAEDGLPSEQEKSRRYKSDEDVDEKRRKYRQYRRKATTIPRAMHPPPEIRARFGGVKVCTRKRASFILDISDSELRRREKDGIYPHAKDKKGRTWFDEGNLRRIMGDKLAAIDERSKGGRPPLTDEGKNMTARQLKNVRKHGYDAKTAAIVFMELRAGKSVEEIIVEKEVHPDEAIAIFEAWSRVRALILLQKEDLDKLAHLPLRGGWPPQNAEQFVLMIRGTIEPGVAKCARCKESYARLCATCASSVKAPSPSSTSGSVSSEAVTGDSPKTNGAATEPLLTAPDEVPTHGACT